MKHRREIFAIALPAIVSNLTTPVLGLVDVAITGHIGAAVYIGAIAVGGAMFNMLYWLFGFLRMGTSGVTAQAYGAADRDAGDAVLWRALLIGAVTGLVMIALSGSLGELVLRFMDADGPTQALARRYFSICIWGAPAVLTSYAMAGWFIGMQDSKAAMWMAVTTNIVNIAVSVTLVFGFDMKIEGVATGTTVAQWTGALLGFSIVLRKFRPRVTPLRRLLDGRKLLIFFRLNADIFLRTCCLVAVTLWFTHAGAVQSTDILAANALLLQLFMLFSYFMDGFAYAGEALAGKYTGAGDRCRLHTVVTDLLRTGIICAGIFTLLYFIAGEWFVGILSDEPTVVSTAVRYLPWAVAIPLCGFLAFVWDGIFIGLVAARAMLVSMLVALVFFFGLYFGFTPSLGNDALWLAFNVYLLVRGISEWGLYAAMKRRMS